MTTTTTTTSATTTAPSTAQQRTGTTVRDGVRLAYEVAGAGKSAIALLPGWAMADRRSWAAQVEALSVGHRVVSYDGRGSGESDRPTDPAAYDASELVADGFAVLDAIGVRQAVLVGNSLGGLVAYLMAAQRPERLAGLVLVSASVDVAGARPSPLQRAIATFDEPLADNVQAAGTEPGWARYNRNAWERDFGGFVRWFVETALGNEATEADLLAGIASGLDVGPEVLAATVASRRQRSLDRQAALLRAAADAITCPVLVITGDRDQVVPPAWGSALAWLLSAEHVVLAGAGHCPHVTRPAEVARLITDFVDGGLS